MLLIFFSHCSDFSLIKGGKQNLAPNFLSPDGKVDSELSKLSPFLSMCGENLSPKRRPSGIARSKFVTLNAVV